VPGCKGQGSKKRANYLQGKKFEFSIQKLSNLLSFAARGRVVKKQVVKNRVAVKLHKSWQVNICTCM
jgi:hypothetical protein